jgi:hypothetical protein
MRHRRRRGGGGAPGLDLVEGGIHWLGREERHRDHPNKGVRRRAIKPFSAKFQSQDNGTG